MAVEIHSVQLLNRLLRFPIAHFDKAEALGAAGLTVPHNAHEPHTAYPLEQAAELVLGGGGREIANMDPLRHRSPLSTFSAATVRGRATWFTSVVYTEPAAQDIPADITRTSRGHYVSVLIPSRKAETPSSVLY